MTKLCKMFCPEDLVSGNMEEEADEEEELEEPEEMEDD